MENQEMLSLWRSYSEKLETALEVNRKNSEDITRMKVKSLMNSMRPIKLFTIIVGLAWVMFVDILIVNLWHVASPFFLASAIIQAVLSKIAIGVYVYQLIEISGVDISGPVVEVQKKIARLKSTTLWVTKFLFLQLPVWTTFHLSVEMLKNANLLLLIIQIIVTTLAIWASAWLFLNIRIQNRHKKWFRLIFQGREWEPLMKSMEILEEEGNGQ